MDSLDEVLPADVTVPDPEERCVAMVAIEVLARTPFWSGPGCRLMPVIRAHPR